MPSKVLMSIGDDSTFSKSHEGKVTTLQCMKCKHRGTFTERQFKTVDGLSCEVCRGPVSHMITKPGEVVNNRRMKIRD